MTLPIIATLLGVVVAAALLWDDIWSPARDDGSRPDMLAYVASDGEVVEVALPATVNEDDVWSCLAWIDDLPEVARV